jgi:uncharacterized CHY-type Zn-finger protein
MRKAFAGLALLAAVLVAGPGCVDRKELNEPKAHIEGWMSQSSPSFHGNKISGVGLISCPACHGQDLRGGTSGMSCYKCHNGPGGHPAGWLDTTSVNFHGNEVASEGPGSCISCHGQDYKGKKDSGVSCYLCHNGPSGHPAQGFFDSSNPNYHGLLASRRGLDNCARCHGADFSGGTSGQSCKTCHPDQSGHTASWMDSTSTSFHGKSILQTGPTFCGGCHGGDFRGGQSGVSCYTCHNGPSGHPAQGWLDSSSPGFHGQAASVRGITECAACHGQDYKGGTSGVSCFQCHNGPSGHPTAGWLDANSQSFHGIRVSQTGIKYCSACHGSDYLGGISGISCFTCHNGPSGHPVGWFDEDSPNFHGRIVKTQGTKGCTLCHGEDLSGGISGVGCAKCH